MLHEMLLALVDEAFNRPAWHGQTLLGSLRGVTARQASWRPRRGSHNIWEVAVHAAYWKHLVRQRLIGDRSEPFPLQGSNWFTRPADGHAWEDDLRLLRDEHRRLRAVVAAFAPRARGRPARGKPSQTAAFMIRGIAAHDLYHAGQIQLLKRLRALG